MIRVVLDTNVLASAALTPSGFERRALQLGLAKQFEMSS